MVLGARSMMGVQMAKQPDCVEHNIGTWYARVDGVRLHRKALAEKLGRELVDGEVARHTCDNKRCINPEHLIVGSQGDNVRDAFERHLMPVGSQHPYAKLDEQTVRDIREEYIPRDREHGTRAIARRLGVSQWVVSHAIRGITWKGA